MRSIAVITLAVVVAALDIPSATQNPTVPDVASLQAHGAARALPRHDWSQWGRDDTHNAVSPEKGISLDFQLPYNDGVRELPGRGIAWSAELGSRTMIPPVVSDGLVWCGTNARHPADEKVPSKEWDGGVLMCFRESDGMPLWRHRTPRVRSGNWVEDFATAALGSAPLVEGDRLWYVNNRNEVVCLDISRLKAGTGTPAELWKLDTRKDLKVFPHLPLMQGGMAASVAGWKDKLYVVTHNGVDESHLKVPSPDAPSVVCLEKATGKLVWKDCSPGKNIMDCQISSPLTCEVNGRAQVIVGQGDGWLRSFDPATGALLWKCDLNEKAAPPYELGGTSVRNYIIATPVLYEGRVYIPTGQQAEHSTGIGALYCIDPTKDGDVSRELDDGPMKGKPNPNSAVVWYTPEKVPDDAPRVLSVRKNGKSWDRLRDARDFYYGRTIASVAAHDGLVYAGELSGSVFCFDARTGRCYWYEDLKASIWGQPLWADGKVFVGTDMGDVTVFAHGKEKKLLGKFEAPGWVRAGPVYANRTLYVTTENTLYAIRTPK
jgi:outer membrane protein assembly factor BamB